MPSFTIKVPNNDEGMDLGEYQSDYLPRVGDRFSLMHPIVSPKKDYPFLGVVMAVDHEAVCEEDGNYVVTTVWLVEEYAAPTLYCDCSEEEQAQHGVNESGDCGSCGRVRRT